MDYILYLNQFYSMSDKMWHEQQKLDIVNNSRPKVIHCYIRLENIHKHDFSAWTAKMHPLD